MDWGLFERNGVIEVQQTGDTPSIAWDPMLFVTVDSIRNAEWNSWISPIHELDTIIFSFIRRLFDRPATLSLPLLEGLKGKYFYYCRFHSLNSIEYRIGFPWARAEGGFT